MGLSSNIRRHRDRLGLTQAELAKKLNLTYSSVSQWETGRAIPRMGALKQLADLFGTTVADLMGEDAAEAVGVTGRSAWVPLVATSHMGAPEDDGEPDMQAEVPASVAEAHPRAVAVHAQGGCMDRRFPADCIVLVDATVEPKNGDAVMARFADGRTVIRTYLMGAGVLLLSPDSWSDEYEDIVVRPDDEPVELAGTVVWYQQDHVI